MSRFSNLEFGEGEGQRHDQEVMKDESFYLNEGNALFQNGRFEEALRAFSKVLEFNPQNAGAWTSQVRMLIELEEFPEAKLWADKALEKFPDKPELLAAKAVALARLADLDAALAFSDASIEERGSTPYIWLARGDVLLARREKRAEYCFEKAVSLAPGRWVFHWLASRIHRYYAQFSLALKFAQQALHLAADHAILWLEVGRCQAALGLSTMALDSFEQARQLDPRCAGLDLQIHQLSTRGFWHKIWHRCRNPFT